jgi:hypothetical protein
MNRLGDILSAIVITTAAAYGLYYLFTWEPPPIPHAGHGQTLNTPIWLIIAHIVWDYWPAKIGAIGFLAFTIFVGLKQIAQGGAGTR